MKIIKNAIRCLKCGDVIESVSVHDFKFCSCQACAVDGGKEYLRRVGEMEDWEDVSIVESDIIHSPLFDWNGQTEFGEAQAWYLLKDGTTIEVCHETEGLKPNEYYYSLRRHCTNEDFDNDTFHDTMGVMESYHGSAEQMRDILDRYLRKMGEATEQIC